MVEVVLAVGVVAFAFVAVLGLIPAGLTQFRQAVDTSVCAQIAQRVIMDAQQTDFETLIDAKNPDSEQANMSFRGPKIQQSALRFFDEQGNEVVASNGTSLTAVQKAVVVYHVNTRIRPQTTLPLATGSTGFQAPDIATITVEVAFNPGNRPLSFHPETTNLSSPKFAAANLINIEPTPGVVVKTYNAQVGRN